MNRTLCSFIDSADLVLGASAKQLCTFAVGGELEYFITPKNLDSLVKYLTTFDNLSIKYKIVGNMSNILPRDGLNKGIFISTRFVCEESKWFGNFVTVPCGYPLGKLCVQTSQKGLSGIENLVGIPGTVGGAIFQNAGSFGSNICDCLQSLLVYSKGTVQSIDAKNINFGYRSSDFQTNGMIVLTATFKFHQKTSQLVTEKLKQTALKRAELQPSLPSAGSVFKKTENFSAGYLIDQAGLKGTIFQGAQISDKHANFIVNLGSASSQSVKHLINLCEQTVKAQFGISLEREIEYIGENNEDFSRLSHP